MTYLDGSFECLDLDARGLEEAILLHVDSLARLAVDAPRVLAAGVFRLPRTSALTAQIAGRREPDEREAQ
jgi:hypothetical protein